jgi:hypothetical protein
MTKQTRKELETGINSTTADQGENDEPLSYERVRRRLNMVINNLPRSANEIYSDQLLKHIRDDLVEIRAALAYLERQGGRQG